LLGYATLLLDDAKTFSKFADKKNVDEDDVKIAIQMEQEGRFCRPPTRNVRSFWLKSIALPIAKINFFKFYYVGILDFNTIQQTMLN